MRDCRAARHRPSCRPPQGAQGQGWRTNPGQRERAGGGLRTGRAPGCGEATPAHAPAPPMTKRVSPSAPADIRAGVSNGVPPAPTEMPPDGRLTSQASGEMDLLGSESDLRCERAGGKRTPRRSGRNTGRSSSGPDLRTWAAALAATLPPMTRSQVAAVARIAARLDASDESQGSAAGRCVPVRRQLPNGTADAELLPDPVLQVVPFTHQDCRPRRVPCPCVKHVPWVS